MATSDDHHIYSAANGPDINAGVKEYLNQTYTLTHTDVAENLRRWFQARTANDSSRAWISLRAGEQGQETT